MSSQPVQDALARVIEDVVAPGAAHVDASGEFPRKQIDALAQAGLLALTVPAEYGGGGGGLRDAAEVVRELGAVCGSTAMIVTMHYSATAAIVTGRRQGDARGDRRGTSPIDARVLRNRIPQPLLGAAGHRDRGARQYRGAR